MSEYGYYSRVLKKDFDTLKELEAAEKKYAAEQEEKKAKENKRGERAKEINDAFAALNKMRVDHINEEKKLRADHLALEKEAELGIKELMSGFCDDYGAYHTSVNGDMVDNMFKNMADDIFTIRINWPLWPF